MSEDDKNKISKYTTYLPDEDAYRVRLRWPLEHAGKSVTELTVRGDANVADLEAMDKAKGDVGKTIALLSELTGASMTLIRKCKPTDYAELQEVTTRILGKEPPETGGQ